MNRSSRVVGFMAVIVMFSTVAALAQRRERNAENVPAADAPAAGQQGENPPPPGIGVPVNLLMQVLDIDGDGELSKKEIAAAAKSLRKLDTDHDGKLSREELMPAGPPPAMGAPGAAPRGFGGAPGPAPGGFGGAPGAAPGGFGGAPGAARGGFGGAAGGAGGFSRAPGAGLPPQAGRLMGFDRNKDGRVTRDELPEEMHALFERLDLDRNGSVDARELRAALGDGGR